MPAFERPYESLEELHNAELHALELMFSSGSEIAISAAMDYCAKHDLAPPPWLAQGSAKKHCDDLLQNLPRKRGRHSGAIDRYRQDSIDYERWDSVNEIREQRELLISRIDSLNPMRDTLSKTALKHLRDWEMHVAWIDAKKENVFSRASKLLERTRAFGGPDAIKKSFQKVERNMSDSKAGMRYRILDTDFQLKVGTLDDSTSSQGKHFVPFYLR